MKVILTVPKKSSSFQKLLNIYIPENTKEMCQYYLKKMLACVLFLLDFQVTLMDDATIIIFLYNVSVLCNIKSMRWDISIVILVI